MISIHVVECSTQRKGCCFGGSCEYNPSTGGCTFRGYCKFQF